VIGVGFLNTYNFMDGVNGITVSYSLVVIGSMYFLLPEFSIYFQWILAALMVFAYFNLRSKGKAICFAGDVGSVSIGFLILIPLAYLIFKTNS